MMLRFAVGRHHVKTNMTEEGSETREGENDGAGERYFVCIELTHVTIVKSPRDTWLPLRGAPVLCVIHVVIEESTAGVGVSEQKKEQHFSFFFFYGCGFCSSVHVQMISRPRMYVKCLHTVLCFKSVTVL